MTNPAAAYPTYLEDVRFGLLAREPTFARVSNTGDKFVFRYEDFAAVSGLFNLLKTTCEGSRIDCDKTNSSEGWIQGAGVREAKAEVNSGSCLGRFVFPSAIDFVGVHRGVGFLKIASRNVVPITAVV